VTIGKSPSIWKETEMLKSRYKLEIKLSGAIWCKEKYKALK